MHQIIVVLIALALIEAHYAVWIPAAVAHKTAQEVVTTGNAVDRSRLWRGKHGLNGLLEFRGDTLVGVDHQHVITGSILLRALALDAIERLQRWWEESEALEPESRFIEIPVVYGGAGGPDLAVVAAHCGLSEKQVVELHSSVEYVVWFLGFQPGFPYLGSLPEQLHTPRRAEPRLLVPAGSVGIGGPQTGVYPLATPGGWQLIGHTSLSLFDPARDEPILLRPGDSVRFVPQKEGVC